MRVGNVVASIGLTATLVCVGSFLTGLGTRNRKARQHALVNMSNQLSYDIVQITKTAKGVNGKITGK